MKIVRKALLATAVATALSPAAVMADTTLFGNFDIAVAIESAEETAVAIEDSPGGDNVIGIEGDLDLENGNSVTYQYIVNVDLDGDGSNGFGDTYHAFIGYKWDSVVLRARVQDLPERLVMDKVDQFAGTYADHGNLVGTANGLANLVNGSSSTISVGTGTTADSSLMLLGGNDSVKYAVSLDTANNENSNDDDSSDGIRFGGMVDFSANESTSFAAGFESLTDAYDTFALTANLGVSDSAEVTIGFEQHSFDASDADVTTIVLGGNVAVSDTTTLKAQFATQDADDLGLDDDRIYFAIGADFALSDNCLLYTSDAADE